MRSASRVLLGCLVLPSLGCHWIADNPDTKLNSEHRWETQVLAKPIRAREFQPHIWVRVRAESASSRHVRSLSSRVRQTLQTRGWVVVEDRSKAVVWLDLDIRFWGVNPIRDLAQSTWDKLRHAQQPDQIGADEVVRSGRYGRRAFLLPLSATISALVADVVEHNLIVDLHVKQPGRMEDRQTLVIWVRKIGLVEQEAAIQISEQVLKALREVF